MWIEYFTSYMENAFESFLKEKAWNYKDDLCFIGSDYLSEVTNEEKWHEYILKNAKWLVNEDGSIVNWKDGENNIDKISFAKSLAILWRLTGDDKYKAAIDKAYEFLKSYPRTETGNFWHKDIYPNQVWLDGLYMAMPFYAQIISRTGEDKWDDIIDQFQSADKLLWDEDLQLHIHGCDVSRKADWADPVTGRSQCVWLRAEGWYLMALADVYEYALGRTERADELKEILEKTIKGMLKYQDKSTSMFYQVVDQTDADGNYPETSGSAMAAYAIMKGARLGMLSSEYWSIGSDILDGIRDTYLKKEEDGYHLYGICASAGLGKGPDPHNRKDRDGSLRYYLSEAQMTDNQHGTGACMMAVSEQLRGNN